MQPAFEGSGRRDPITSGSGRRTPLIEAHSISVAYRGKAALSGVTLALYPGEIVTLIGPNGAGKTTLARVVLGLLMPSSGRILRAAALRVGYVPQRFPVDKIVPLTVGRFMNLSQRVAPDTALRCLEKTGAVHLMGRQLAELSGGEFQRVLLARALAREPQLLVLDEPAQAVDFAGAAQLYDLIDSIRRDLGCGILLISHDLHIVLGASDRVICLNRHICCEGVPRTVASHPEYARLFGPDAAASFGLYPHRHNHTHSLSGEIVAGSACGHEAC